MTRPSSRKPVAVSISPVLSPVSGTVRVPGSGAAANRLIHGDGSRRINVERCVG